MSTARPVTIFIAEDNPILLQGLDRALSASGYAVETAPDGFTMLERLATAATPPDLLLLDVMMPGMTGVEVLEAVQADGRYAGVPVMLITAAIGDPPKAALPGGEQVEVLVKPFRLHDLLTKIEEYVRPDRRALPPSAPESMAS